MELVLLKVGLVLHGSEFGYYVAHHGLRPLQKGIFLHPALFANAHLLLNKLRFTA